jgi:hypothetical protein
VSWSDAKAAQAGLGGNDLPYHGIEGDIEVVVLWSPDHNAVILNAGNGSEWVDIEMDFDNVRWLIKALQDVLDDPLQPPPEKGD